MSKWWPDSILGCQIWQILDEDPADETSAVSADKTSAVSADKTSVVSLCQQTSPKTPPKHSPHRGGRFAAAPVGGMLGGMSWEMSADTMTQQMSCLLTQQMSCLQTHQMSCLQTQEGRSNLAVIWRQPGNMVAKRDQEPIRAENVGFYGKTCAFLQKHY